tara:strand:+ start:85 stop:315 length:231 start_codon:yes stop_codon:yes gene_type:complete
MNSQEHQIKTKITKIGLFADDHEWFNPDFIVNVENFFNKYKRLSEKQLNAIDHIINKCCIEKWFKNKYPDGYEFDF